MTTVAPTAPVRVATPPVPSWNLVAPWYRWGALGVPAAHDARATGPAIQKYCTADFVKDLLADPQRSVRYNDDDRVYRVETAPALPPFTTGPNKDRSRQLSLHRLVRTDTRKLFQPAHQRFYVVVCELHCDVPGFPPVTRDQVASAGFVVRRRRTTLATAQERKAAGLLADLTATRMVEQTRSELAVAKQASRLLVPLRSKARTVVVDPGRAVLDARIGVEQARRRLAAWAEAEQLESLVEGWMPSANPAVGSWAPVADEPSEVLEKTYPLYPLPPAPGDPTHAALGSTMWFGVIPVASDEAQPDGVARFDEVGLYEVRCFVRQHCGECPGPLVWSLATEPYKLAGFFDLTGCSNRPVNVRLPSLPELEAQAASLAKGAGAVRMTNPPNSALKYPTDKVPPTSGSIGPIEEICFFSIPMITIIASFVLNLFLPIVMLLFGLWWMLKLKFCIPPSAQLEADVSAELAVIPGGISAAVSVDVDVDLSVGVDQQQLQNVLRTNLDAQVTGLGTRLTSQYTNNVVLKIVGAQGVGDPDPSSQSPSFAAQFDYEAPVARAGVSYR